MGQSRPLFRPFPIPITITISIIIIEKNIDGVLGIRPRGRRMVDTDNIQLNNLMAWFKYNFHQNGCKS